MTRFKTGDRVRIGNCGDGHGNYSTVTNSSGDGQIEVRLSEGPERSYPTENIRPVPNTDTELYYRERDTLTNIWGDDIPDDLRNIEDDELLWEMRRQVTQAIGACYADDDMQSLGILFPLEYKLTEVLSRRIRSQGDGRQ